MNKTKTPVVGFAHKAHEMSFLLVEEKPETQLLLNLIKNAKDEEKKAMKTMFIAGFMLGNASYQLGKEIDIDKEFDLFFMKKYELI